MKLIKTILSLSALALLLVLGATPVSAGGPPDRTTIYDIASESPDFTILTTALDATGLGEVLDGRRQFTVFAPTDDAFAAAASDLGIPLADLLDFLLANPDYLTDVLLFHVAPGRRDSIDVLDSVRIRTLQGSFLLQDAGTLTDGLGRDVGIVAVDILADNGIIHVLDNVVLPYAPPL
jgi:uncharacterized surface protein with fasciclin (FAS1) repeats